MHKQGRAKLNWQNNKHLSVLTDIEKRANLTQQNNYWTLTSVHVRPLDIYKSLQIYS